MSHPNNVARKMVFWLITWGMVMVLEGNRSPYHVMNIRVTYKCCKGGKKVVPWNKKCTAASEQAWLFTTDTAAFILQ